jgi:hypothetical protein
MSCKRFLNRVKPYNGIRKDEGIALVCFGTSLNKTWEEVKKFKYVMSCSGGHKFLMERGIVPNWHVELDPRPHKIELIGNKISPDTEFLMASCCHPLVFDHLEKHNAKITLWHTYSGEDKNQLPLVYPLGDWVLTGGCNVGLRAMVMCRFLGFNNLHIFGMDGSFPAEGNLKHASFHPNICKDHILAEYEGKEYATTTAFLEAARRTFHEIEQLPDVNFTFYGEGLVQDMAKKKIINRNTKVGIAFHTNQVISDLYRQQNREMHENNPVFGTVAALRHVDTVLAIYKSIEAKSILDYGCGKGMLGKQIDFPIWEYDPAIPGKDSPPRAADLVVCIDVLEHIEPEYLDRVLEDIHRCTKKIVFFALSTALSRKTFPDGRNSHLLVHDENWWKERISKYFMFMDTDKAIIHTPNTYEIIFVVAPKPNAQMKKNPGIVINDEDCLCVVR